MPALPQWVEDLRRFQARSEVRCEAKVAYRSERNARSAGRTSLRSGRLPVGARLYVYACRKCHCWHLTRSKNSRVAITAEAMWEGVS